jgi:SagB-type dehydrogenase family enzyme
MVRAARGALAGRSLEADDLTFIHHYLKADPAYFEHIEDEEPDSVKENTTITEIDEQAVEPDECILLFKDYGSSVSIPLPQPVAPLNQSLSTTITERTSRYEYRDEPIRLPTLSALLYWSAGVKGYVETPDGSTFPLRFAPSAGSLQPVNLYVIANLVEGFDPGVYYYHPANHALVPITCDDVQYDLRRCCMQEFVSAAPVVCALTCSLDRVQWRYGARAYRSAHLDAGVMCQNLYLVGTALDLCVCAVFGFFEDRLQQLLHLDDDREYPTLLFTIGHPNLELTAP